MFYVAGIVLFATILALITQSWDSGSTTRILLSAGLGATFWSIAIQPIQTPMISAVGLIGTAVMATTINRRYIK